MTNSRPAMKRPYLATLALLGVTAAWGAAFVVMKPAIEKQPFYDFLATRFTIAALVMIAVRPSVLRQLTPRLLATGLPLGAILGLGYVTQTLALELTTAAITGFLTGLYVVLTPLLAWVFLKNKLSVKVLAGVVLATGGLALISITDVGIQPGHVFGIMCALLYALHIVGLGKFSARFEAYPLTVVQLIAVAAVSWVGALADGYQAPQSGDVWFAVVFTAVFATAIAFFAQTWAQARMDASRVAIILTAEVVFAAGIAVGVGQETLTLQTTIGGLLMVAAMLLVEWPSRKGGSAAAEVIAADPLTH
ncbi:MAG: DMT family transporter [Actinomycetales bacterium]|nr:DMT family transporter [Actinomycetales bacterium]